MATSKLWFAAAMITLGGVSLGACKLTHPAELDDAGGGGSGALSPTGGTDSTSSGSGNCEGPLGAPRDPATLTPCCSEHPGNSACVSDVPASMQNVVGKCDGGGYCVPNDFIKTGGVFSPKDCKSINGPGVCLSLCIPQVAQYEAILSQDVCGDEERCTPCINPLDMTNTHACEVKFACGDMPTTSSSTSSSSGGGECPHMGPDILDPSVLTPCPSCSAGGAHCLDKALVPASQQSQLDACDDSHFCVPDILIKTGGNYIPPTCKSVAGFEGRCLSRCLPEVESQAAQLPQDICDAADACVPCYNPQTGMPTGACNLSCDPGPSGPPMMLPTCCGGIGQCVPTAAVPADKLSELGPDSCPADQSDLICVPIALEPGGMKPPGDETNDMCETGFWVQFLFGSDYKEGRCLPTCIPKVDKLPIINSGSCSDAYKCVPCLDPTTGKDSGACM